MTFEIITTAIGILGLAAALRFYLELRRWATLCQRARIAIFFKRRSRLQAPLVEWLTWASQLNEDDAANGRTVYVNREHTVALYFSPKEPSKVRAALAGVRRSRNNDRVPVKA